MMYKEKIVIITGMLFFIVMITGISYGYFTYNKEVTSVSLNTGDISIDLSNVNSGINLTDVIPLTDYEGMNSTNYIDFTINGTVDIEPILYDLQIIPKNDNTLDSQYVKVYLTDQQNNVLLSPFLYTELVNIENNNGKVLYQEMISSNNNETTAYTKNFRLRVWIDENYSEVTSKTFTFDINLHAYNVDGSKYKKVSFNAQDGRVGLSKYVEVGEEYGALPTPTKEGYTFMGWNGKNLLNYNDVTEFASNYGISVDSDGNVYDTSPTSDPRSWGYINQGNWITNLKDGTYTFSILFTTKATSAQASRTSQYEITPIYNKWRIYNVEKEIYTFSLNESMDIGILIKGYDGIYKVQLERGNEATKWEPYYIESTTEVVQPNNHTLTAIWEANS